MACYSAYSCLVFIHRSEELCEAETELGPLTFRNINVPQYTVSESTPSAQAIEANAEALARYAAISQQAGLVPIVEPEVLMAGDFTIQRSMEAHIAAYSVLFAKLALHKVDLAGLVLKASMVVCGDKKGKASPEEVGEGKFSSLSAGMRVTSD